MIWKATWENKERLLVTWGWISSDPHHSWIQKVLCLKQFRQKYKVLWKTVTLVIMKKQVPKMSEIAYIKNFPSLYVTLNNKF